MSALRGSVRHGHARATCVYVRYVRAAPRAYWPGYARPPARLAALLRRRAELGCGGAGRFGVGAGEGDEDGGAVVAQLVDGVLDVA
jgi:hypothetical protein